ncbi:MAG TPA: SDR family oxidoreductase, partial [Parvibaculum sp.]
RRIGDIVMEGLKGKSAIVTGALSGIGRAIVSRLHAEGMRLAIADLEAAPLEALAEELGAGTVWHAGDLSEEKTVLDLTEKTVAAFGGIDVLVNNAGGGVIKPFLEHTPETLHATLNRNLWTVLWCCRAAIPVMLAKGQGRIVNIGADSVRNGLWDHAVYNAAKGGVHGLTTGLAREFAQNGITINTVAPCMVATPPVKKAMAAGLPAFRKFADVIPMGRPGEVEEIASMVAYLAAPEASFVTGQVISVNGGSTML